MSWVAFCRQCYLPDSACRCLESSSTTSTASTTGPLWSDIADPTFGTNPAPAGRGTGSVLPYGSSATAGGSIWDLPSMDFPRLPGAPSAIRQPRPPCWEGFSFGKPANGHPVWTDCTARSPETWMPPTTQNRRRVQLPPPPPKTDSASTTDQSQQTTAPDPEPEGEEPSDPGEPGHVAVIMDPPHCCLVSHTPPNRLRDVLVERLDLNSGGLLTGTRWPSFRTTVVGVGKKTWTFTWEPILGSITGRSQPPSGLN